MNIWFFVLLVVVASLVIGPIAMLRPSPAQKRKEKLRMHASQRGVRFTLRHLPQLKTDIEATAPMPVYYLPPENKSGAMVEWILMRTHYVHEGNFYQEWDWQGAGRPVSAVAALLTEQLPKLPASVVAISEGNFGTCVYWSEREEVDTLDMLIDMLVAIQQANKPLPD